MSIDNLQNNTQQNQQKVQEKQSKKGKVTEKPGFLSNYHSKFVEKVIFNTKFTPLIKFLSFLSCITLTSVFFLNYKAYVKYAGNEVYFKSWFYDIPIENQLPTMFLSEQFQVNLFTYEHELLDKYKQLIEYVNVPAKWVEYDSKKQYDVCTQKICFISTYGEADGIPFQIFSIGMSIFSVILILVQEIRTQLVYGMFREFFKKMEIKYQDSERELNFFRRNKTIYGILIFTCRIAGPIAALMINIMAHFAFHKYFVTHVGSATMITISMGLFFIHEGFLMGYVQKRIVPELRFQNILDKIRNRNPLYKLWNSKNGVVAYWVIFMFIVYNCAGFVFNFTHQSIHEYLFITLPIFLQLIYVVQFDFYKEIIKQVKEL